MNGFYVTMCQPRGIDEDDQICIQYGIFTDEKKIKKFINKLNKPAKDAWKRYVKQIEKEVKQKQKKWDELYDNHSINNKSINNPITPRPEMNPYYINTKWEVGLGFETYYHYDTVEIH